MIRNEHRQQIANEAQQKTVTQLAQSWRISRATVRYILRETGTRAVQIVGRPKRRPIGESKS